MHRRQRSSAVAGRRAPGRGRCRRRDPGDRPDPEFRPSSRTGRLAVQLVDREPALPSLEFRASATRVVTRATAPEYNAPHLAVRRRSERRSSTNRARSRSPVAVRQSRAMTTRRDHRPTHVRPRPPSTGRPAPVKVKPRSPGPNRLASHRPIQRGNGLPIVFRLALIAAVVALGVGVLYVAVGGLGKVAGGLGSTRRRLRRQRHLDPVADAPRISYRSRSARRSSSPTEPYTTRGDRRPRRHRPGRARRRHGPSAPGVPDAARPAPDRRSRTSPSPTAPKTIIPVELTKGINDFTVTIVGPGGESEPSAAVRYVFDAAPPKLTITSPKKNAVVNGKAVDHQGQDPGAHDAAGPQRRQRVVDRRRRPPRTGRSRSAWPWPAASTRSRSRAPTRPATWPSTTISVRRGSGKLTVAADRVDLPDQALQAARAGDPDRDGDRSGRQGAGRAPT